MAWQQFGEHEHHVQAVTDGAEQRAGEAPAGRQPAPGRGLEARYG
jgi:hypothetical protein